ncbi:hypothetical protein GCM10007108_07840 [Thermogymnomonas acidicola]|uniref:DUF106 domain-containing protein n=1 Tax=Thermogymnomonas acidicola TaxID=399579 RepID=A0AA37BQX9_9ARCH|nr:EMC3/TMCO1 family protein [Thermogymnomonas acidicola]GGM72101.1 hypothetical protein GCM10007108_07840 [Thermogymnomonas acidicola]
MAEQNTQVSQQQAQQEAMRKMLSFQMIYMMVSLVMLFIVASPSLRTYIGMGMNRVFVPLLGFNYMYPLISLIFTGLILGIITSVPRYFFTDWVKMGQIQERSRALSKAITEAYRNNQRDRLQKLQKIRMDMALDQQVISMNTLKPFMVLTVFTFLIFAWLYVFVGEIPYRVVAFPWDFNVNIQLAHAWIFPYWIIMYALVSLVVGYFITMVMKLVDFTYKIRELEKKTQTVD